MKRFGKIMLQGLVAMLPAILTIYILIWLFGSAEKILGGLLEALLPNGWYLPGMGVVAGILTIFLVGVALNAFLVRRLLGITERLMNRIPVIKIIYGSLKDFIGFFTSKPDSRFSQVVTVDMEMGGVPMRVIGFVTRSDFRDLPEAIGREGEVAVYIPMSFGIGGYTVVVPRSAVVPVQIPPHRAMGFVMTGGLVADKTGNGEER